MKPHCLLSLKSGKIENPPFILPIQCQPIRAEHCQEMPTQSSSPDWTDRLVSICFYLITLSFNWCADYKKKKLNGPWLCFTVITVLCIVPGLRSHFILQLNQHKFAAASCWAGQDSPVYQHMMAANTRSCLLSEWYDFSWGFERSNL